MNLIEWKQEYELGIGQIDLQHKNLVGLINELHEFVLTDGNLARENSQDALVSLANYVVYHFDTEEDLMRKYNYTDYEKHKKQHESFKDAIANFRNSFDKNNLLLTDVTDYLKNWILNHVVTEDKALVPYLKSQGLL